jgi:hypothetical protein
MHRPKVWKMMIDDRVKATKKFHGPDYYNKILESKADRTSDSTRQIDLDLARTFPSHRDFGSIESPASACVCVCVCVCVCMYDEFP